jgi:hypothetical protein
MLIADFIASLKLSIDDTGDSALLSSDQYESIVTRSLGKVNGYLNAHYQITNESISPEFESGASELIFLQSMVFIAEVMRAKVAKNYSFKSGDKSIDKTKQASVWADLHRDYLARLRESLKMMVPHLDDSMFLSVKSYPSPEIYEVSGDV